MVTLIKTTTSHQQAVGEYCNALHDISYANRNNNSFSTFPFYTIKSSFVQNDYALQYHEFTHRIFQDSNVLNTARKELRISELMPYDTTDFCTTLPEKYDILRQIGEQIILRLTQEKSAKKIILALLKKEPYIYYHSIEVMCLTMAMAQYTGYSTENIYDAGMAAVLHDIGKALLSYELLHLEQEPDLEQQRKLEMIPILSAAMTKKTTIYTPDISDAILSHQENFIGTGYPFAKMQKEIHPYGMLIHVADDYDTIIMFKRKPEYAKSYIQKMLYRRYSFSAVNAFNSLFQ